MHEYKLWLLVHISYLFYNDELRQCMPLQFQAATYCNLKLLHVLKVLQVHRRLSLKVQYLCSSHLLHAGKLIISQEWISSDEMHFSKHGRCEVLKAVQQICFFTLMQGSSEVLQENLYQKTWKAFYSCRGQFSSLCPQHRPLRVLFFPRLLSG